MAEFKLTYFDARARGEVSRIMLTYAGIKFIDNRIQRENWPEFKPKTPLGSMPLFDIDGGKAQLCQSMAIARYVARETGLAGKDSLQHAQVDMIATSIDEKMSATFDLHMEQDATKKSHPMIAQLRPRFVRDEIDRTLNTQNTNIEVTIQVTLADFMAWHVFEYLITEDDSPLDKYPKLKAHRQIVSKLPKFAEYQKNRPKTAFLN